MASGDGDKEGCVALILAFWFLCVIVGWQWGVWLASLR
jgi:hypothetical protein